METTKHKIKLLSITLVGLLLSENLFAFWWFFPSTNNRTNHSAGRNHTYSGRSPSSRGAAISCQRPNGTYAWMACTCYNEAGNQSAAGQRAVLEVVKTRSKTKGYPSTTVGVMSQCHSRRYCQFSWINPGVPRRSVPRGHRCLSVAKDAMNSPVNLRGPTNYHANYVAPKWRKRMTRTAQIGAHIFYRQPGAAPRYGTDSTVVASVDIIDNLLFNL